MADLAALSPLRFRPLREDDLPRLMKWLQAPHVAAWWQPMSSAEIEAKYLPRLGGETRVLVYLVRAGSDPIGMIQVAPIEGNAQACTIDLLIGEAACLGIGLGPRIIDDFTINEIFGRLGFTICFADPVDENRRSVRAFEKAGFTRVRSVETDGRSIGLMVRERD